MASHILVFLAAMLLLAAFLGQDFIISIIYLVAGVYLLGCWWNRRAIQNISVQREFNSHAFLGDQLSVRIQVKNEGWLPIAWLTLRDYIPVEVAINSSFQELTSLGAKTTHTYTYTVQCRKRGYYAIGPLDIYSNDLFGWMSEQKRSVKAGFLTVFPKIIPFTRLIFPSSSPIGLIRTSQPVFEDASRVRGKREYMSGDSLRLIDWKASAVAQSLQVKLFEPAIAHEAAIFINLNTTEYALRARYDMSELAIIVAASLANHLSGLRQSVGLYTNGLDPSAGYGLLKPIPPRRGRGHLLRILEVLARLQISDTYPIVDLLKREYVHLSWGTTIILITNLVSNELLAAMYHAHRSGLNLVLIICGSIPDNDGIKKKASLYGFSSLNILKEKDLDFWRQ